MAGPGPEEIARVSSYMLAQGEKHTWTALWPRVVQGRLDFLAAIDRVSAEQAAWKPNPDDWSIEEVAQHVLDGSKRVANLIVNLSQGREASLSPQEIGAVDPAQRPADAAWPQLVDALIDDSRAFANLIEGLPEPPAWQPRAAHPFFGELHGRAWYLFQRVHDIDHANQVKAIKAADGYPA